MRRINRCANYIFQSFSYSTIRAFLDTTHYACYLHTEYLFERIRAAQISMINILM